MSIHIPPGDLEPSISDKELTRQLKEAGDLLGIEVLDHVIIGRGEYYFILTYCLRLNTDHKKSIYGIFFIDKRFLNGINSTRLISNIDSVNGMQHLSGKLRV